MPFLFHRPDLHRLFRPARRPTRHRDADDFVELRRQALSDLLTHHVSTNHSIELNGDEATCISGMVIYRRVPDDADGTAFDTHCIYTHTLVRTPDGWKISKVKQQILWNTGDARIHAGAKGHSKVGAKNRPRGHAKSRPRGMKMTHAAQPSMGRAGNLPG